LVESGLQTIMRKTVVGMMPLPKSYLWLAWAHAHDWAHSLMMDQQKILIPWSTIQPKQKAMLGVKQNKAGKFLFCMFFVCVGLVIHCGESHAATLFSLSSHGHRHTLLSLVLHPRRGAFLCWLNQEMHLGSSATTPFLALLLSLHLRHVVQMNHRSWQLTATKGSSSLNPKRSDE
jgi:hypothetical protein